MKINKANNNDSASIIIPKKILKKLNWKINDECIMAIKEDYLIIKKNNDFSII